MKFVSYRVDQRETYGVYVEEEQTIWNLQVLEESVTGARTLPDTLLEAIGSGIELTERVKQWIEAAGDKDKQSAAVSAAEVEWLAPIPRPAKNVMCIGKNYRDHAIEMGGEESIPKDLMVFTKAPTAVIAANEPIPAYEGLTDALDYEGELGVIIGKKGKGISREEALDYIFGYTIINDVTARDLQKRHKQFFIGKSLDGTCPMGPWIVSKDEIADPHCLDIETKVNGEVRQQSNTKHFIFPIDEIISTLSKGMTLEPGDVIATGTPAGVGQGMNPPGLLKSGDTIDINIEQIGTLSNKVQ
ncbi:fumarylacetoacetate hydrolase family protein [Bacillus badius]|uniref:Fumarylacetoacetate hydrolase family protein n=1 Tax=Bacillus badius TaxID=1455 RepID=A0ABR5ASI4_BACBA|nr:fumarylacetoacetate hydrolase family protein [Bacillus badius]KIL77619.1 Fumarylacetoacetate hydrolase family protein [Bacillus badius]MED4717781.1 fumarylacetoacetate hydrolase family protein [Bacillus badius]